MLVHDEPANVDPAEAELGAERTAIVAKADVFGMNITLFLAALLQLTPAQIVPAGNLRETFSLQPKSTTIRT